MIQANELRVGNLIKSGRIIVPVDARTIFDIWDSSNNYSPIPLTPALIEKCGFVRVEENWQLKEGYSIQKRNGKYYFSNDWSDAACYILTDIKYLHQLQNLYFALTGKELEIKK